MLRYFITKEERKVSDVKASQQVVASERLKSSSGLKFNLIPTKQQAYQFNDNGSS